MSTRLLSGCGAHNCPELRVRCGFKIQPIEPGQLWALGCGAHNCPEFWARCGFRIPPIDPGQLWALGCFPGAVLIIVRNWGRGWDSDFNRFNADNYEHSVALRVRCSQLSGIEGAVCIQHLTDWTRTIMSTRLLSGCGAHNCPEFWGAVWLPKKGSLHFPLHWVTTWAE